MLVRHVSEAARKAVCALHLHLPCCLLRHILVCADPPPSPLSHQQCKRLRFQGAKSPPQSECAISVFGGRAIVLVGLTTMPVSSSSRRRKAMAFIVLAVTPIRPKAISPMHAKASTPALSSSSLACISTNYMTWFGYLVISGY